MSSDAIIVLKEVDAKGLYLSERAQKDPTCCGRKVSLCHCISSRKIFAISALTGAILLTLGLLALGGSCTAPPTGPFGTFLQRINSLATWIASKLGSDVFTVSIYTASIGAGFTFAGVVGYSLSRFPKN